MDVLITLIIILLASIAKRELQKHGRGGGANVIRVLPFRRKMMRDYYEKVKEEMAERGRS